jgi:P27 family predicted phage terminase small subunit
MTPKKQTKDAPKPPRHLKPQTKAWFRTIVGAYVLESHHVLLLRGACEAWDEMQAARELVRKDGMVTTTKKTGAIHAHPAVAIGQQAAIRFARLLRELNLDADPGTPNDARPPRIGGRKW